MQCPGTIHLNPRPLFRPPTKVMQLPLAVFVQGVGNDAHAIVTILEPAMLMGCAPETDHF